MNTNFCLRRLRRLVPVALVLLAAGCGTDEAGKLPITTSSDEAREYYLQGRDLVERLRGQDSKEYFEKAIAADSNFAAAHLQLAFAQTTPGEFFYHFDRAKALMGSISEGERLWIQAVEAGNNGYPMRQRDLMQELVAMYPNDERMHGLLGNFYFGQQDWQLAIEQYEQAIGINPKFTQPYNQLGYAYRFLEQYDKAEDAFRKYIKLIPDDPNPYDSYAELLMKMGKFNASIESYERALGFNPNFVPSHVGIASNLNFKGKYEKARKQLKRLLETARNDGERRQAWFATAVSYADEGNLDKALDALKEQYLLAVNADDAAARVADLSNMGFTLLEMGKPGEAQVLFDSAQTVMGASDLSDDIKANNRRFCLYCGGRAALVKGDLEAARRLAGDYRDAVEALQNRFQVFLAYELDGRIALADGDYDGAITNLEQANLQNPYVYYLLGMAHEGKGETEQARQLYRRVAAFNQVNSLNLAFIRLKAASKAESL